MRLSFFAITCTAIFLTTLCVPSHAFAHVYISEIAWMGVSVPEASKDEWIELYNDGDTVSLAGWKLTWGTNNTKSATLPQSIDAGGYAIVWGSTLVNSGEFLVLKNANGVIEDAVDGSNSWMIDGVKKGNNDTSPKQTMQRNGNPPTGEWVTAVATPLSGTFVSQAQVSINTIPETTTTSGGWGSGILQGVSRIDRMKKAKLSIGLPKEYVCVVDAPMRFHGEAKDEQGRSAEDTTIRWNFGDGATAEGKDVEHIYQYAGEYVLTVEGERIVFSKKIITTEQRVVRVLEEQIRIASVSPAYVELENVSDQQVDISDTILRGNDTFFFMPEHTLLLPETRVRFPRTVTGVDSAGNVELVRETGMLIAQKGLVGGVQKHSTFSPTTYTSQKNTTSFDTVVHGFVQKTPPQTETSTKTSLPVSVSGAYGRLAENPEGKTSVWWWILAFVAFLVLVIVVMLLVRREEQEVIEGYTIEE